MHIPGAKKTCQCEKTGAKQSRGDPTLLCRYTQGRNKSCSFFVNLDPYPCQGKKLWYVLRVCLDPEIGSYYYRTIAELLQLCQKTKRTPA